MWRHERCLAKISRVLQISYIVWWHLCNGRVHKVNNVFAAVNCLLPGAGDVS